MKRTDSHERRRRPTARILNSQAIDIVRDINPKIYTHWEDVKKYLEINFSTWLRRSLTTLLLPLMLSWHSAVFAVPADLGSYESIKDGFHKFVITTHAATSTAISAPGYVYAVDMLWLFFAIILVIFIMFKFSLKGANVEEIIAVVLMAMLTRVLIATFDTLTSGIWEFGNGIGDAVQQAMVGTKDVFFAPSFIAQLIKQISMPTYGVLDIAAAMYGAIASFVIGAVAIVLSVLAFLASIWAFWGYTLAKIIGLLFVPFLLYERLAFLFDGWMRFFFGFIVYAIVARINVVLVVVALAMYLGVPIPAPSSGMPAIPIPRISNIIEMLGLLTFALVGIVALASTGRFAATILAGAGGGGIGAGAAQLARSVASIALGKK